MSTTYLAKGYPFPMPVLTVRFRRLADSTASAPQVAIVDTGADMTMAPAAILTDLQAQELQETNLISQWGDAHPVILCLGSIGTQGLSGKSSGKVGSVDRIVRSNLPGRWLASPLDSGRPSTLLTLKSTTRCCLVCWWLVTIPPRKSFLVAMSSIFSHSF